MIVHPSSSQTSMSDPPPTAPPVPMRMYEGMASWQALRARRWYAVIGVMMLLTCGAIVFCLQFGAHALTMAEVWKMWLASSSGTFGSRGS